MRLHLRGERIPHMEDRIFKEPVLIREYINHLLKSANIKPKANYTGSLASYALDVMKERWLVAEKYIKRTSWAPWYAKDLIVGRWHEAEPYIIKSDGFALGDYLANIDKQGDHWEEGFEGLKKRRPWHIISYLNRMSGHHLLTKRSLELEHLLVNDKECAVSYALSHRRFMGRWHAAEYAISKSSGIGRYVGHNSITIDDWPEAYATILESPEKVFDLLSTTRYIDSDSNFPLISEDMQSDMEKIIASSGRESFNYATRVLCSRFYSGEAAVMMSGWAEAYIRHVIKDRWLEYEDIISDRRQLNKYIGVLRGLCMSTISLSKIKSHLIKNRNL